MLNRVKFAIFNKTQGHATLIAVVIVAALAVTAGVYLQQSRNSETTLPPLSKAVILPTSKAISGVNFVDYYGADFTAMNLTGHWSVIFFGFTNCPDICPTTMHTLKRVKEQLRQAGHGDFYQIIMVTVDPGRDTVERLASYVPYFDASFVGLRGTLEVTTEFARQLGILFVAHEANEEGAYEVDHSTSLILINRQGEMAGVISAPHQEQEISRDLIALADHFDRMDVKPVHQDTPRKPQASQVSATSATNNQLQIRQAWIRPAPSSASSMAGYLELHNASNIDITIIDVASQQFEIAMFHETRIEDNTASMHHLDELIVPANSSVVLKPNGLHLMLVNPQTQPQTGDRVQVSFTDDAGNQFTQEIEVRENPRS